MEFKDWLVAAKNEEEELGEFITKLEPYFSGVGFNGSDFEKLIKSRLTHIDQSLVNKKTTDGTTN